MGKKLPSRAVSVCVVTAIGAASPLLLARHGAVLVIVLVATAAALVAATQRRELQLLRIGLGVSLCSQLGNIISPWFSVALVVAVLLYAAGLVKDNAERKGARR